MRCSKPSPMMKALKAAHRILAALRGALHRPRKIKVRTMKWRTRCSAHRVRCRSSRHFEASSEMAAKVNLPNTGRFRKKLDDAAQTKKAGDPALADLGPWSAEATEDREKCSISCSHWPEVDWRSNRKIANALGDFRRSVPPRSIRSPESPPGCPHGSPAAGPAPSLRELVIDHTGTELRRRHCLRLPHRCRRRNGNRGSPVWPTRRPTTAWRSAPTPTGPTFRSTYAVSSRLGQPDYRPPSPCSSNYSVWAAA